MTDAEEQDDASSLATTLEDLFRTVLSPAGVRYTLREVAEWCEASGHGSIRPETIRRLRKGYQTNTTLDSVAAIGHFFGVPASSLADEASRANLRQQLAALRAERARGATAAQLGELLAQQQMLARRAGSLSSREQDMLFEFLDVIRKSNQEAHSGDEGP